MSLEEDSPSGDVTSESIFKADDKAKARIIAKEDGILCGTSAFYVLQKLTNRQFDFALLKKDAEEFISGETIAEIDGLLITILKIERPLLNLIQYLSGIATETAKIVSLYKNLHIFDTRKTLPGYRKLAKYAVYCGGGWNHRLNLSEMAMLKDNHISRIGSMRSAVNSIKQKHNVPVEIEIDSIDQLQEAMNSGAEIILLDNFSHEDIKMAVKFLQREKPEILIEVSGGISPEKLKNLSELKGIGVSMGHLTHTTRFLDLSLEII